MNETSKYKVILDDGREFIFDFDPDKNVYTIISYIGSSGEFKLLSYTQDEIEEIGKLEKINE